MAFISEEVLREIKATLEVDNIRQEYESVQCRIRTADYRTKFADLAQGFERQNVVCFLKPGRDGTYLLACPLERKGAGRLSSSPWVPRALFCVVVAFVMIDGYYRTDGTNQIVGIGDPLQMAMLYTAALLGILGVHEMGHLIASKVHKMQTTWPYFIPGLPIIGIPTFGALIMAKGMMINRDKAFDVAVCGPLAGLVITVLVAFAAAAYAPVISEDALESLYEENMLTEWQFGEPLLMTASLALFDKNGSGEVLMTPLMFAAWVGFFLTFANLMPAGQLDGGHMVRTVFGKRVLIVCTYASVAVLVLMNFWFIAMFVLIMGWRRSATFILDDITKVTGKRILVYVCTTILGVLCAPLPDSITVIEPLTHLLQ